MSYTFMDNLDVPTPVEVVSGVINITSPGKDGVSIEPNTSIRTGYTRVGSQSGGVQLSSGACTEVKVKSITQSGDIWIGAQYSAQSGNGFLLESSEEDVFSISNLNKVYVIAQLSGVMVSWRATVA